MTLSLEEEREQDDTVFGGRGGTGIVADIEVGVCRFSVDGCGFVGVYED